VCTLYNIYTGGGRGVVEENGGGRCWGKFDIIFVCTLRGYRYDHCFATHSFFFWLSEWIENSKKLKNKKKDRSQKEKGNPKMI
jgi:hypothetical protein